MQRIREIVEIAYFVSGIVVAGAILYGLQQIGLLKRDIRIRNERAAKERAIEFASRYLNRYVALQGRFVEDCTKGNLAPYKGTIGNFDASEILRDQTQLEASTKRYSVPSWLSAMNELESISAAFTSGVADEETGFKICGRSFCGTVQNNYDLIVLSRMHNRALGYWSNIVELYKMWAPRLRELELRESRDQLESEIAKAAAANKKKVPIGLE